MTYYPNPTPEGNSGRPGLLHESALSIRLALVWPAWLLFCLVVVAPVGVKVWPGAANSMHRWLYYITWLGCLGWSVAGVVCAMRQLNSEVRPRTPVGVGLGVCLVLLLISSPAARFLTETARSTMRLQDKMPWNKPDAEI